MSWVRGSVLLACLFAAGDLRQPEDARSVALTTIAAIRASLDGPERLATVDVRAVATFFDAKEGILYLQDDGAALALRVGNPGATIASGTRVGLTGEIRTGTKLPVVRGAQITALELAVSLPDPRPVSVAGLLERRAPAEWVMLSGLVRAVVREGDWMRLELEDEGRRIHVAVPRDGNDPCLLGSRVRLRGVSMAAANGGPRGEQVLLVVPDSFNLRIEAPPPRVAAEAALLPPIRTVRELRQLTDADARRGFPIQLVGVVTCCGPGRALFIDDGSAGTYIESRRHLQTTRPGDRVEVTGVSAGDFVPIVDHPRVRTLGHGPLPLPRAIGPEQLVAGEEDGQWVAVEGIVRSVTERRYFAEIYVSTGGFVRVPVEVPLDDASAARGLIDARVRVRGVRGSRFNSRRQLAGVALVTSGLEMLTVLTPPPQSSSIPLLPLKALLQFVPGQRWEHQVRARGTVTYASEGELYIHDETGGLPARGAPGSAAIGDLVEVVGFGAAGLFAPALEDARLLSRTPGTPVSPKAITAEQALSGRFEGDLVRIDASMLASSAGQGETQLSLQAGPYLFTAVRRGAEPSLLVIRPGSELRLTGICSVNGGRLGAPQGFQILLRSPEDVRVLRMGPWWTSRRATWLLSVLASVAVLTLAWVFALKRRVQAQSAIIWSRVKRETELQERQRLARELHDTLEQTLTGVSLSLEAASLKLVASPPTASLLVERAIRRVGQSLDEVRRVVWALRDESLDLHGLAASLRDVGRQLASCHSESIDVEVAVEGHAHPFVLPVENNLLRIGQEALTNAVKHGKPSRIDVRLHYDHAAFRMVVTDDGLGFDSTCPPPAGHFGLAGMRERAAEIGARLQLSSRVNRGTEVQVTLDLGDRP